MGQTLTERIVQLLEKSPLPKKKLIQAILSEKSVTIQAIYKALRSLDETEIITQKNDSVSLSLLWIEKELTRWDTVSQNYHATSRAHAFMNLREGESLKLKFKNLRELELYWTQAFVYLEKTVSKNLPVYSIIPHDWFYSARPETDTLWIDKSGSRTQRIVLTHPLTYDRLVSKKRSAKGAEVMIDANPLKQKESQYFNTLGQWLFEVSFDTKVNESLVSWLKQQDTLQQNLDEPIRNILSEKGQFTLKISASSKRTNVIQKKLQKYF
jgi:hypothetical protein